MKLGFSSRNHTEKSMIEIRKEKQKDYDKVRIINDRAFGQPDEGHIVDKLRESCKEIVSLVAVSDNEIIGHIFFSPVTIETPTGLIKGMGLAPMAVLPEFQNRGVGSRLVNEGLRIIKKMSYPFVIVLGHETYYPRFGFERASKFGLQCQWESIPNDAFMVKILDESVMKGFTGIAKYRDEFNEAV